MWAPVHDEEWDGDIPLGLDRPESEQRDSEGGTVVMKGDLIPWEAGRYEVSLIWAVLCGCMQLIRWRLGSVPPPWQVQCYGSYCPDRALW